MTSMKELVSQLGKNDEATVEFLERLINLLNNNERIPAAIAAVLIEEYKLAVEHLKGTAKKKREYARNQLGAFIDRKPGNPRGSKLDEVPVTRFPRRSRQRIMKILGVGQRKAAEIQKLKPETIVKNYGDTLDESPGVPGFSTRLAKAKWLRGYTEEELAEKYGVSKSHVQKYEREWDKARKKKWKALAQRATVGDPKGKIELLLFGEDEEKNFLCHTDFMAAFPEGIPDHPTEKDAQVVLEHAQARKEMEEALGDHSFSQYAPLDIIKGAFLAFPGKILPSHVDAVAKELSDAD